jgi:hypothetical protein
MEISMQDPGHPNKIGARWVASVLFALLVLAIFEWSESYYQFLRLSVCTGSLFLGYVAYKEHKHGEMIFLFGIALLFNPVFPVELEELEWKFVNVTAAIGIFAIAWFRLIKAKLLSTLFSNLKMSISVIGLMLIAAGIFYSTETKNLAKGANAQDYTAVTVMNSSDAMSDTAPMTDNEKQGAGAFATVLAEIEQRDSEARAKVKPADNRDKASQPAPPN